MPTVSVDKALLYEGLGREYTTEEFDELCFQFGIELDEDTTEQVKGTDERPTLKIDIPANRYDLLCFEGILRALRIFLGQMEPPKYCLTHPAEMATMHVREDTKRIRPYFAGAILRNITFTPASYANFIDLQDKLHQNLARRRTLVSMGTHDLDTIQGPFSYEALPPKEIRFAPLNRTEEYDASQLMELYESDRHLARYLHIIRDSPVYPIIYDSQRRVMSMPPIINSNHSKITLETKNVFLDVTALDKTKLDIVLSMLVTMFSEYCAEPFTVEPVRVVYADGTEVVTPNLDARSTDVHVSYVNRCTGLKLDNAQVAQLLQRMGHSAVPGATPDEVQVGVPVTRPDILHECDLMEDVAVAYGFDNLPKTFPNTNTVGAALPINKLSDIMRHECAYAGWTEALPLILCSHDENFSFMNRKDDGKTAIVLENPKTAEYQVVRTSLLPGILKTIRENKKHALPMRVFEASDVAFKDPEIKSRMSRNERHMGAVYCNKTADFEVAHGLLDKLMLMLGVPHIDSAWEETRGYYIKETQDSTYLPGRAADIYYRNLSHGEKSGSSALDTVSKLLIPLSGDVKVGTLGVLHPNVLHHFDIGFPCSALEFNLEAFL
ncbi:phenylalanine--tRNA ligase [Malassezia vespertilionis]|uniref:Phenylalanine--tRNA ligase beta subunit n=1 Tax=Malassezia vespertilionis TaxID=2020962 RepID=A0A2N1J9A7_9BASI|nr:phenylalanine--tRNA ligase [Malassezia vespertilionis]PKI83138.1 Frs1p [Malassezia vespertilionis]WFD07513.1 phenylalanine--tRNA ligase [Malassezia vespertilionis]